jgi:hypothetical protein
MRELEGTMYCLHVNTWDGMSLIASTYEQSRVAVLSAVYSLTLLLPHAVTSPASASHGTQASTVLPCYRNKSSVFVNATITSIGLS